MIHVIRKLVRSLAAHHAAPVTVKRLVARSAQSFQVAALGSSTSPVTPSKG
jgi:hypothetical protein